MRQTVIFAPNNVRLLDLAVASDLFGRAATAQGAAYDVSVCSEFEEVTTGDGQTTLRTARRMDAFATAHTVVILGNTTPLTPSSAAVQNAIRGALERGARIAALSTGAFVLASAGILRGQRATTSELYQARFEERFSETILFKEPFVDASPIFTSGDFPFSARLCLELIAQDCGKPTADHVRSAFFEKPLRSTDLNVAGTPSESRLSGVLRWAKDNIASGPTLDDLIKQSGMSSRSFHRYFQIELRMSPIQWLRGEQIREARRLLEEPNVPIDSIWRQTGFDRERTFRTQFKLAVGVSPAAYRSHKRAEA